MGAAAGVLEVAAGVVVVDVDGKGLEYAACKNGSYPLLGAPELVLSELVVVELAALELVADGVVLAAGLLVAADLPLPGADAVGMGVAGLVGCAMVEDATAGAIEIFTSLG